MTTITIPRALLEQALEKLLECWPKSDPCINGIRAELAKQKLDPTGSEVPNKQADQPELISQGQIPAWHDAPTEPGLWMCNEGDNNPYRWTTHRVTFPLNQLLVGEDERWYGPIPQDGGKS